MANVLHVNGKLTPSVKWHSAKGAAAIKFFLWCEWGINMHIFLLAKWGEGKGEGGKGREKKAKREWERDG